MVGSGRDGWFYDGRQTSESKKRNEEKNSDKKEEKIVERKTFHSNVVFVRGVNTRTSLKLCNLPMAMLRDKSGLDSRPEVLYPSLTFSSKSCGNLINILRS